MKSTEDPDGTGRFMLELENEEGTSQWNSIPGQRCDSTRVELAAAIVAMMRNGTVHIGIDSAAMLSKARKLIQVAIEWCTDSQPDWLPKRNPCKIPWGLQTDGDLWLVYFEAILARGPGSNKLYKVKAHATAKDIREGEANHVDKIGNDKADDAATKGIEHLNGMSKHVLEAINWLAERLEKYQKFMQRVHRVIMEVIKAEKEERVRRRAIHKTINVYDSQVEAKADGKIKGDEAFNTEEVKMVVAIPVGGPHQMAAHQVMYEEVSSFLATQKWRMPGEHVKAAGTTWLELSILFDIGGYRSDSGRMTKDPKAAKSAEARRKKY